MSLLDRSFSFALALTLAATPLASAQTTLRWTGGAADWNLTDPTWTDGGVPTHWPLAPGDGTHATTAEFFSPGDLVTITDAVAVNRLVFVSDGYSFSTQGTGSLTLAATGDGAPPEIDVWFAEHTVEMHAPLAGSHGLIKSGAGRLLLTGDNTFTGSLRLTAGTVRATTSAQALGAGTVDFTSGATLELAHDTALAFGRDVTVSNNATAQLVADRLTDGAGVQHTFGNLTMADGYLALSAGGHVTSGVAGVGFGDTTLSGYAVFDAGAGTHLSFANLTTNGNSAAFNGAGDFTIAGSLQSATDNFQFSKAGGGTLTLAGAVNTLETLYLAGGAFVIQGGTVTGKRADINGAGASIHGADAGWTLREHFFLGGDATTAISGGASLVSNYIEVGDSSGGRGELVVTGAGSRLADTATGGNWGLFVGRAGSGSSLTVSDGATATNSVVAVGYEGGGAVLVTGPGSSWTVNGNLYLGYVAGGAGSVTVADGATGSSAGDFYVGAFGGTGALTVQGAGSKWTALGGVNGGLGNITLADGGTLQVGDGTGYVSIYHGVTLQIGTGGTAGVLAAGSLTLEGAVTFDHTDNLTFGPQIVYGAGTFTQQGAGTLTLSRDNGGFSGTIAVRGGTLRATTSAAALGTGPLTLAGGALQLANNAALNFGNATTVAAHTTITSDRGTTNGNGVTHTLGTLSLGANTLSLTRGARVTGGTAGLAFGATTLTAPGAVFNPASGTLLTLGALSGDFAFSKTGAGQLTLGTASTRTGATTTLTTGTLRLAHANALGTTAQTLNLDGGALQLANNAGATFNGTHVVVRGNATATADRTSSSATSVTQTLGTLAIGAHTLTTARGALITGGGVGGLTFGATTLTGDATFSTGANTLLTLGTIADGGNGYSLTKSGAGTLALNGAGGHGGGTTIVDSRLLVGHDTALGTGPLTLNGNATLQGTGGTRTLANAVHLGANSGINAAFDTPTGNALVLNGVLSGAATVGFDKFGAANLTLGGANTFTGEAHLYAGTVTLAHNQALGTGIVQLKGATLQADGSPRTLANQVNLNVATTLGGASDLILNGRVVNLAGTSTLTLANTGATVFAGGLELGAGANATVTLSTAAGAHLTVSGVVSNGFNASASGLTKSGPGTATLSGLNTYGGATTLTGGILAVTRLADGGAASALGQSAATANRLVINGGTLRYTGGATTTDRLFQIGQTTAGATATLDASGTGALVFTGAGNLTYGTTNQTRALVLTGTSTAANTLTPVIANNGSAATTVTKNGTGTWVLAGANTYRGATTVAAGRLHLTGSAASSAFTVQNGATLSGTGLLGTLTLASGALLSPGNSPGTLSAGDTTWAGGARYEFELNAATGTAGTNWDLLAVSGTLAINATSANPFVIDVLSLTSGNLAGALSGFAPGQTYTWELATATGGITGFAADRFSLNTSAFTAANTSVGGTFALQLGNRGLDHAPGSSLDLVFVAASAIPEPSTYAAIAGALVLALAAYRRRRVAPRR